MDKKPFLDTIWARLIAGLVAVAAAGALVHLNREALLGAPGGSGDDGLSACLEERLGRVEAMIADGTIKPGQAAEFRIRARQFCEQAD